MIEVQTIPVGRIMTNAYLIRDAATGDMAIIDPGLAQPDLLRAIEECGKERFKAILLTHGHYDHIGGVAAVQRLTGAKIYLYEDEKDFPMKSSLNLDRELMGLMTPFVPDVLLKDGDTVTLGETVFTVLHTPGHTIGGCCYVTEGHLFSGDILFHGSMGRTDFPTGDPEAMMTSLRRLAELPGDYAVYPGHGPESTLDWERKNNPFMRQELGMMGKTDDFVY